MLGMRKLAVVLAAMLAAMLAGTMPARADIRTFNEAMQAKDYKKAAVAAASAWATLDKARPDIAVIGREFGFAALMSADFEAARTYAKVAAAASSAAGEDQASQVATNVLLQFAELKVAHSVATRNRLFEALQASSALPGIDVVSYLAVNALVSHDVELGKWRDARASAALGEALTGRGSSYAADAFRFGLVRVTSQFMDDGDTASYAAAGDLIRRMVEAIDAAPSDAAASPLVPIYWSAAAWRISMASALDGKRNFEADDMDPEGPSGQVKRGGRSARLLSDIRPEGVCRPVRAPNSPKGRYPTSALYKGLVGTVILRMDIDSAGKVGNAEILAAAPEKHFGEAALKLAKTHVYKPAPDSPAGCLLAQKGLVLTVSFTIDS